MLGSLKIIQCDTRSPSARITSLGVVGEAPGGVALGPAAALFERLRQVPVVERREGADAGGEQRVDEAAVVSRGPSRSPCPLPFGWMRGQAIEKR